MITEDQLLNAFSFSNSIENECCNSVKENLSFANRFKEIYDREKEKLPYHINLIDELSANENAHSKILGKLFQKKSYNGKYEILTGFVEYLKTKGTESFAAITVEAPQITREVQRIDLWIRDKSYTIIIENKIHDAPDRSRQLERYIDISKASKNEEQIFVIYLPPTPEKEPDEESWGKYFNSDIYRNRYLKLSFRNDILPWLLKEVLPNIEQKEVYLQSAVRQYIDHLEGMFNLRIINNKMNMELQKFIKKELGIQENNPGEALEILETKREALKNAMEQIELLKSQIRINFFPEWAEQIKRDFPDYEVSENWKQDTDGYPSVAIDFAFKGGKIACLIEIANDETGECYYGIKGDQNQKIPRNLLKLITDRKNKGASDDSTASGWYIYEYSSYQDVYGCFKTLVEEVIESIG
jgi:hypothetical protein